jgi:hypothetical protein
MMVMMIVVMMIMTYSNHPLRLRRDRGREAEGKHKSKH